MADLVESNVWACSFCMLILHCKLIPKSPNEQKFPDRVHRYGYFKKWHLLKQTKTKIRLHFERPTFYDYIATLLWAPKRYLHSKGPKNVIILMDPLFKNSHIW